MLTKGVKLIADNNINVQERIYLSNGSERATTNTYLHNAYIPRNTWRKSNAEEINVLTTLDDNDDFSTTVCLRSVPNEIINLAEKMKLSSVISAGELEKILSVQSEDYEQLNKLVEEFVQQLLYPDQQMIHHGFCINEPNIETVSYERDSQRYLGLHLDTSVAFNIETADVCPNRIAINLSKEKRYLLFVNKTVKQMTSMILSLEPTIDINSLTATSLVNHFFTLYPDYPVIRITQNPYEAYIAPTDNIIHDGSTKDNSMHDITLIHRGYLNPFLVG